MTTLVLLAVLAADLEAGAAITTEAAAGSAPVVPGQAPRAGVSTTLQPALMLRLLPRGLTLFAEYRPRLHWRHPNLTDSARPLLLHSGRLGLEAALGPRTQLGLQGSGSVGEADYASLPQLLGTSQGALPARLELLTVSAGATVRQEIARRWQAELGASISHRRPLDEPGDLPGGQPGEVTGLFARQRTVGASLTLGHQLTRADQLTASAAVTSDRLTLSPDLVLWSWQSRLGWNRRIDSRQSLQLSAGAAYVQQTRAGTEGRQYFAPLAQVGHTAQLGRWGNLGLESSLGATVEHYVDPVLGNAGSRATASSGWTLRVRPAWAFVANALFSTSVSRDAQPDQPDETLAAASLAARHRSNDHLVLEAGGRWSDRGPHLSASSFDWHQRELWLYVSATLSSLPAGDHAAP